MKFSEKFKNYIREIVREESEENVQRLNAVIEGQEAIAENVRDLNAQLEGYESLVENVRNLNAQLAGYESLVENVRNLNAQLAGYESLVENVRNLNAEIEVQEAIAENVRNLNAAMEIQEAVAENVRNLNATAAGYEALAENVRHLNGAVEEQEAIVENVRNLNNAIAGYEALAENVRNLNAIIEEQEAVTENVRNLNNMLINYESVVEDVKNNNTRIEALYSIIEMQKVKLVMLEKDQNIKRDYPSDYDRNDLQTEQRTLPLTENVYAGIDYFDFENHFRGSREQIKRNQQQYVKYYEGKSNVIDLGCGRGEFLELLKENNIGAKGVDLYDEFVELCHMHGLDVICDDALHFLSTQQKTGGIFAGQLIEHLSLDQLVELCRLAYDKLEEDACVILETPNPTCLAIYSQAFYVDPSHIRPVHPLTVKYILEKSGFSDIEIIYTDTSRLPVSIPPVKGVEGADKFNDVMHMVSELLFGSQDYAIIARKHDGGFMAS